MDNKMKLKQLIEWTRRHRLLAILIAAAVITIMLFLGLGAGRQRGQILTDPIQKGSIIESVYGIGTVTAKRSFQLKLGVTSTIRRLFVKEGDQVKHGQRLADLDGVLFSAPFDGTITLLPFKVGETVFPQSVVLSIVDLGDRYALVTLEQQAALRVRRGQKAKLSFDSLRAESYDGQVEAIYSNDNNFFVRIGISDLPPQILPGMTADVAIGIAEQRDALIVPVAAIDAGKVYVKRGLGTTTVAVKTGIVDGAMAEIVAGDVREGEQLVIRKKIAP
jgi:multidrug efflux pump subunit AcrA (membrane-fusion protein)